MRKTTSALAATILGAGSAVVLSVAVPGTAGASGCGPSPVTNLDQNGWTIPYNPNNLSGTTPGSDVTFADDWIEFSIPAGGRAIARYDLTEGIPLADQTAYSNYGFAGGGGTGAAINGNGVSYQLVLDFNGPAEGGFTQLVNERAAITPDDEWYSTRALPAAGLGAGDQTTTATLVEISAAYPDAVIGAFLLQLGKFGDPTLPATYEIGNATFGCNEFDFAHEEPANAAPSATFTAATTNLSVNVDGSGSSDDGTIQSYSWNWGDGSPASAGATQSHTYSTPGDYTITLTVTDDDGATGTVSKSISVTAAPPTVQDKHLAGTGADVLGLAAIGGLVVAGSAAGLIINRRRKANASA